MMAQILIATTALLMTSGISMADNTSSRYVYGDAAPVSSTSRDGFAVNSAGTASMQSIAVKETRSVDNSTTASTRATRGFSTTLRDR